MAAFPFFGRKAAPAATKHKQVRFQSAKFEAAGGPTPEEEAERRRAAAWMPGSKPARKLVGEAIGLGATGVLLEQARESMSVRRRIDGAWRTATDTLSRDDGAAILEALETLAGPQPREAKDVLEGECIVRVRTSRWPVRVVLRNTPQGRELLLSFGGELEEPPRDPWWGFLGRFFRRGKDKQAVVKPAGPVVSFNAAPGGDADQARVRLEEVAASPAYASACALVAAAVKGRASELVIERTQKNVAARGEVDGVWKSVHTFEREAGDRVVALLKKVGGLDPEEHRRPQFGRCQTVIDGKPWPCRVMSRGVQAGERVQVSLDYGRLKPKTLADIGMAPEVAARMSELMSFESGLIVLATPRRGGLSTMFDRVIESADRLLREFVVIEDGQNPRPEIQNVKPARWDATKQITPGAAFDLAMREYPGAFVTCDLGDPELAGKMVAQAADGKLVVVGVRGGDAFEGIAALRALGIDADLLGRVLLAAVGSRLVRKVCPKCHEEFLPSLGLLGKLGLDRNAAPTLRRARKGGCAVCTGTGYMGRTGIFEIASGPTLNAAIAAGADAKVQRQAAVKDGMKPLKRDGLAKVAVGVTGIEEIQRVLSEGTGQGQAHGDG